jgi:hypothetical protein
MSGSHFLASTRLVSGYLYSPSCLEEVFSETELPVGGVLGNRRDRRWKSGSPTAVCRTTE